MPNAHWLHLKPPLLYFPLCLEMHLGQIRYPHLSHTYQKDLKSGGNDSPQHWQGIGGNIIINLFSRLRPARCTYINKKVEPFHSRLILLQNKAKTHFPKAADFSPQHCYKIILFFKIKNTILIEDCLGMVIVLSFYSNTIEKTIFFKGSTLNYSLIDNQHSNKHHKTEYAPNHNPLTVETPQIQSQPFRDKT